MGNKRKIDGTLTILMLAALLIWMMPAEPGMAWVDRLPATTGDAYHSWTVVFEQPMDMSTINSQNIFVSNDSYGMGRLDGVIVSCSDSTHALVSPPPGGWSVGTVLYLIVSPDVLTADGSSPEDAIRMQFTVQPGSGCKVYLDDQLLEFTIAPQTVNDRLMVPMRPIFEAMGAVLDWDDATQTATAVKGSNTVVSQIGNNTAFINGEAGILDVAPMAISGCTLAPLRFVAEAFGYSVRWDSASQTAYISAPGWSGDEILLTPDYWIPDDLSKSYKYDCDDPIYGRHMEILNWGQNADGKYIRVTSFAAADETGSEDELADQGSTDIYQIDNGAVNWISSSGQSDQPDSWEKVIGSGQYSVIRPVHPGETWSNVYSTSINGEASQASPVETVTFAGLEDMVMMGNSIAAAHVRYEFRYMNESIISDYWLLKGTGIIKMTRASQELGSEKVLSGTMAITAIE